MRLPNAAHDAHPWLIAQIAPDFKLLDAWALPATGGPDDFDALVEVFLSLDPAKGDSQATRALFTLRRRIGEWLGWDDAGRGLPVPGRSETTLAARVREELRDSETPPASVSSTTFHPLYRTDDEWAAEISNRTVHAVLQLAWVEQGRGVYQGRMGVYVKTRGKLGAAYMSAIMPFRHLIVYPALMRQIASAWQARQSGG